MVEFQPVRRYYPPGNDHATQFKRICGAVITTYPHILLRPPQPGCLVQFTSGRERATEWVLHEHGGAVVVRHNDNTATASGPVVSMADCDRYARRLAHPFKITFQAHPRLTRLVQPWSGPRRWQPLRRRYRYAVYRARISKGERALRAREATWITEDEDIGAALASVDWESLHKLNPGSNMELQTVYRIKAAGLTRWTGNAGNEGGGVHRGCTVTAPTTLAHWFWHCRAARRTFLIPQRH